MDLNEVSAGALRRHPWEVARAASFRPVLAQAGALAAPRAVLDVGAGDGFLARGLLQALPAGSEVAWLDPNYTDDDLRAFAARPAPGLSFVREPPRRPFDLLLML